MDGGTVRESVRKNVGDDSTEEATEVGRLEGSGVADGAGEADWFKGFVLIIEFDERVNASREFGGKVMVEGVETAVEASTSIE